MPIESSINPTQTALGIQKTIAGPAPAALERLVEPRSRFIQTLNSAMSEYSSTQAKTYQPAPATPTALVLPRSTAFMQNDVSDKPLNGDKNYTPAPAALEKIASPHSRLLN